MKARKFNDLTADELRAQEREITEQLFRLKFQAATGQGEGLRKLRVLRRELGRVKTALRQHELRVNGAGQRAAEAAAQGAGQAAEVSVRKQKRGRAARRLAAGVSKHAKRSERGAGAVK